ncbi:hypothetical protein JS533_013520 [Bifidobacterium amazonense]|uniref:Uncharacterized protein n=1 Tax=Bifidobacterium amazonense TaxID=2809027 RepID=A0ABS9VYZ2_9BIFI|nr:hypothetical protein [Bifidobacterium amazonense]MCH9277267.1 hypothetical protein [Bifidobacterium amazonense]
MTEDNDVLYFEQIGPPSEGTTDWEARCEADIRRGILYRESVNDSGRENLFSPVFRVMECA